MKVGSVLIFILFPLIGFVESKSKIKPLKNWKSFNKATVDHGLGTNNSNSVQARAYTEVFQFFSKTGHKIVDEEIPKIRIPNVSVPIKAGPGYGDVTASNLLITKFKSPSFTFNLNGEGIAWNSSRGSVKVNGDWYAEYTWGVTIPESGWVQVIATDILLNISVSATALDGRPQVQLGECSVDIRNLDIQIGGGVLPWLVNLFRDDISNAIRKAIHRQACDSARDVVLTTGNDFLHSLPLHFAIGKNFFIDYSLNSNPRFTSEYVEAEGAVDVVFGNTTCRATEAEHWIEPSSDHGMTLLWISESVPNCLLASAHTGNLVQFTVTKDIAAVSTYLRTSCSFVSICIGRFFSKLASDYPNQYLDLYFHTYKAPFVTFVKDKMSINITFAVDFHINPIASHKENLARLVLGTQSVVSPYLIGNRIVANISDTDIQVSQEFSTIGDMSQTFLNMFEKVFRLVTKALVEVVLHKGIPLPIYDNVTISNTSFVESFDRHIRVRVDFESAVKHLLTNRIS